MAENDVDNSQAENEDEMSCYRKDALSVVTFRIGLYLTHANRRY